MRPRALTVFSRPSKSAISCRKGLKMLITELYASYISGAISCFDRVIIQGILNPNGHPQGITFFYLLKTDQDF